MNSLWGHTADPKSTFFDRRRVALPCPGSGLLGPFPSLQIQAFDELGFLPHKAIIDMASQNLSGIMSSQCSEDAFNHMKNSKLVTGKRRFRRPEEVFAVCLARKVVDGIHRFRPVPNDVPVECRSVRLDKHCFSPDLSAHR